MVKQRPATRTGVKRTAELLRRLDKQARAALKSDTAESVHDLRVAIRRFVQALRVFKSLLPAKERKQVRHRLKMVMARAGAVRDCDITLHLIEGQRHSAAALKTRCEAERHTAAHKPARSLRRWIGHDSLPSAAEKKPISVDESSKEVLAAGRTRVFEPRFRRSQGCVAEQLHRFQSRPRSCVHTVELFASDDARISKLGWIRSRKFKLSSATLMTARRPGAWHPGSAAGKKLDAQLRKEQEKRVKDFHQHWTEELAREWQHRAGPESKLLSA